MDTEHLEKNFAAIGARTKVRTVTPRGGFNPQAPAIGAPQIDIRRDRKGEYFDIAVAEGDDKLELQVLDVQPDKQHLLLMVRPEEGDKRKVLCGHDEMHFFAAPVPRRTIHVADAMERLKPAPVQEISKKAKKKNRNKRKNEAFRRQGEWFFIPLPNFEPPRNAHVGHNEPLQRERGRQAGGWRRQSRVSRAYVRGKVRHPDHHTITLPGWHEVMLNREGAVRNSVVTFID
jgi:hypothetical protein